jgi:hypothetical protein
LGCTEECRKENLVREGRHETLLYTLHIDPEKRVIEDVFLQGNTLYFRNKVTHWFVSPGSII